MPGGRDDPSNLTPGKSAGDAGDPGISGGADRPAPRAGAPDRGGSRAKSAGDANQAGRSGAGGGIELAPGVFALSSGVRFQFARSGGPGGQNVNKLNTKAELWVRLDALSGLNAGAIQRLRQFAGKRLTAVGEIHLVSETERGQEGNRAAVLQRLRDLIGRARIEPKPRRKTKPSRAARARRLDAKKHRGEIKQMRRRSPRED